MKTFLRQLLLGVLVGLILAPSTAQAQFTVFDPAQYSLQIERQIEEANRWLERVKQYSEEINKLAEQLSTMKGVLGQAEKLVLHNDNLTRTMAQIGQTVRDVFALKRAIETMVISRLNMIKSIKTRLMNGIFDPDADLRDFEDEGILFFDFPHFVEEIRGGCASAIGLSAPNAARDVSGDAVSQRQLDVMRKITERT